MVHSKQFSRLWVWAAFTLGMIAGCFWGVWQFSGYFQTSSSLSSAPSVPQIYRITSLIGQPGENTTSSGSPSPLAYALRREFPEVVATTRIFSETRMVGRYQDKVFIEEKIYRADEGFFGVFEFDVVKGQEYWALQEPYSVVMSTSCAKKYFGEVPKMGQAISLDHQTYFLTGIVEDPKGISPVEFDMLISMSTHAGMQQNDNWGWNILNTYLRLGSQASPEALEARLPKVIEKYARPSMGDSYDQWLIRGGSLNYLLQAV
ncbi:ABC transporter permease [bacterium]|nr:ABC transporter permease [bacterium]